MRRLAAPLLLLLALLAGPARAVPRHVYLTWQDDPSRTITVVYHAGRGEGVGEVRYDTARRGGVASAYAHRASGSVRRGPDGRVIYAVTLTALEPATTYYFVAGDPHRGYSSERKFRTLPSRGPLRFVVGGDMWVGERARALLRQAASQAPHLALLGGDLAYADGDPAQWSLWDRWLDNWEELMVTPDGYTIPLITALGNHEVRGGFGRSSAEAPFFFAYFPQNGAVPYFSRRLGRDAVLFVLDSGHVTPPGGVQGRWLEKELERYRHVPWKFALYHVPLYPSHRPWSDPRSARCRQHWLPLFDRYALTAAFEHHDHTLKRTKPLRDHGVDPQGTLYLGDGCFGQKPRPVDPVRRWYEATARSIAHFWRVDVSADEVVFTAVDAEGRPVDSVRRGRESPP